MERKFISRFFILEIILHDTFVLHVNRTSQYFQCMWFWCIGTLSMRDVAWLVYVYWYLAMFGWWSLHMYYRHCTYIDFPDSKVHGANMGATWVLSAPNGPHVAPPPPPPPPMGPMLAPWTLLSGLKLCENEDCQSPSQLFRYTGVAIFTECKWIQWMAATLVRFDIWMYKYGLILWELDWWHGLETLFLLVD